MPRPRKDYDIAVVEADYRAGIKTLRAIGTECGMSPQAVDQLAKKQGWTRDLAAGIAARAKTKVDESAVEGLVDEEAVIEANAEVVKTALLGHRHGITRNRTLMAKMFAELEAVTDDYDLFEKLGELMEKPDDKGNLDKLSEIYQKVIAMPGRVDALKKLTEINRVTMDMERRALNIRDDAEQTTGDALTAIMQFVRSRGQPLPIRDND